MPRKAKGARLYLRAARTDRAADAVWVIRDGGREVSTGCGEGRLSDAERALAAYIASKHVPAARSSTGDPADVLVADVLTLYARERAPSLSDPVSVSGWIEHLLDFFGEATCADVKRSTCLAYVTHRTQQPRRAARTAEARSHLVAPQTARRELEVLSAAIGWWDRERPFTRKPVLTYPEKPESPRDALTRSQAAALLKASLGYRRQADGTWKRLQRSSRANRAHVRRFILIGLYTGTRPGVIPKLLWHESPSQAWADLDAGIIYRRGKAEKDHRTKRRPMVRLPDRLLAHMRRWRAADLKLQARLRKAQVDAGKEPSAVISSVLQHGGEPLAGRLRTAFENCAADAGLPPEVTSHWLRHTAATWLMEGGADLWEASGYLGMTVATLEKCYGHHRPAHQEGARRALR